MSLSCNTDEADCFVEISDLTTSVGTEFCIECGALIKVGVQHYKLMLYSHTEDGDEEHKAQNRCCEECGDLALSWMELGYCWTYGDLRSDIAELNQGG